MISKIKRKIFKSKRVFASMMTFIFTVMLINPILANAKTLQVTNKFDKLSYLSFPDGKERVFFPMKVIVGTNEPVYCLEHAKLTPNGEEYTESGFLDGGIRYIVAHNPNTGDGNRDYFIKQAAIHYYLGQIPEVDKANDTWIKARILKLAHDAKMHKNDPETPGLTLSNSNVNFKYYPENDDYETEWINLKTDGEVTKFQSTLSKAPKGLEIVLPDGKVVSSLGKNDKKFYLRIARDKVQDDFTMEMKIRAIFKVTKVQEFIPKDNRYQKIAYPKLTEVAGKDEVVLKANLKKVYGSLEVIKKGDDGKLLEGAKFSLYKADGKTKVASGTTGKDGRLVFNNLEQGGYILIEDEAPEGYVVNVKETPVQVVVNKKSEVNIENQKIKGRIKITKIDEETGAKLEGAEFEVKDKATGKVLEKLTTNKDGDAISSWYPYGTELVFKEVKAPNKYMLNGKEYFATITENMKTIEFTVTNKIIKGSISIHKVDKDTKQPLQGVEFNVLDDKNNVIETIVTDENGNARTKDLIPGEYSFVEVKGLDGYLIDNTPIKVNVTEDKEYSFTIENEKLTGAMELLKVDNDTKEPMKDVEFKVVGLDGFDKGKEFTLKTNEEGKAVLNGLHKSKFRLLEVKTLDGYVLNTEPMDFEITENGQVVKLEMTNKKLVGSMELLKVDNDTKEPMKEVEFKVVGLDSFDKDKVFTLKTNEEGKAVLNGLHKGKFRLTEVNTLDGYILNTEPMDFEITENGQVVKLEMTNNKLTGSMELVKIDAETKEVLEGVKFKVECIEGFDKGKTWDLVSDENGKINLSGLHKGKYRLVETKALDGYNLNTEAIDFEITENEQLVELEMTNTKIQKVLPATGYNNSFFGMAIIGIGVFIVILNTNNILKLIRKKNN
ncbi:SpaA isopeptide-forming pilin-related protein [Clostridium baratii]